MKTNLPLVNVHVVTYNQEKFIKECIKSILNQTYKNFKLRVFDDCSTDNTINILSRFNDDRLEILQSKNNLGITGNHNRALAFADNNYLILIGGDDVFYKDKIKLQVDFFLKNPSYILCGHKLDLINDKSKIFGLLKTPKFNGVGYHSWIKKGMLFGALSIMFNVKIIDKDNFVYDSRIKYASDWKFIFDLLGKNGRYGFIEETLGAYRKHENNITLKNQFDCNKDWLMTIKYLECENKISNYQSIKAQALFYYYPSFKYNLNKNNYKKAINDYLSFVKVYPFNLRSFYAIVLLLKHIIIK